MVVPKGSAALSLSLAVISHSARTLFRRSETNAATNAYV